MRKAPNLSDSALIPAASSGAGSPWRFSQRKSAAAWAGTGFIVGALFWHTIGFWSFVQATLVPDANSRRAEREQGSSDTRTFATASLRSPIRPTRTGPKAIAKLSDPSHAEIVAPAPMPVILNPTEIASCVTLTRKTGGGLAEAAPCAPLVVPIANGAGTMLSDREPVKAANMLWQAKVDVSTARR